MKAYIIVILRVVVEAYKGYRIWYFLANKYFLSDDIKDTFYSSLILILVTGVMDEVVLILIIISTIVCVNNFGKGLREIILKQTKANDNVPSEATMENL
jgi:hypothetical protein